MEISNRSSSSNRRMRTKLLTSDKTYELFPFVYLFLLTEFFNLKVAQILTDVGVTRNTQRRLNPILVVHNAGNPQISRARAGISFVCPNKSHINCLLIGRLIDSLGSLPATVILFSRIWRALVWRNGLVGPFRLLYVLYLFS